MLTLYRVYWVISVWPRSVAALWGFVISPSFILQHFWYSFVFEKQRFLYSFRFCVHTFFIFVSFCILIVRQESVSLIVHFLRFCYANVRYYLPERSLFVPCSNYAIFSIFVVLETQRFSLFVGFENLHLLVGVRHQCRGVITGKFY